MTEDLLAQLRPGIRNIFEPLGYTPDVGWQKDLVKISLYVKEAPKGTPPVEVRTFPRPTTNKDLAVPLLQWRAELQA